MAGPSTTRLFEALLVLVQAYTDALYYTPFTEDQQLNFNTSLLMKHMSSWWDGGGRVGGTVVGGRA